MSAALFVSDLHLCPGRPDAARLFKEFLGTAARDAAALYILGDLFEYWAGDDDLDDAFNAGVCAALRDLTTSGTAVRFIAGNRDFLAGDAFAACAGLTILEDATVHDIGGIRTLLLHGDTLCTDDADYQRFRREIRSPAWREGFLAQSLAERKAQIEALRRESESEKQHKPMAIMDANREAIETAFRASGCARMIHGHTHRRAHHVHRVGSRDCERWVLGDWYESGNYLVCDENGCRFVPLRFR